MLASQAALIALTVGGNVHSMALALKEGKKEVSEVGGQGQGTC